MLWRITGGEGKRVDCEVPVTSVVQEAFIERVALERCSEDCREQLCSVPIKGTAEDFPGGPAVKTLPSNAGGGGSIRGGTAKILRLLTK